MRRFLSAGAVVVAVGLATLPLETVRAQAGIRGQWTTLPTLLPINPIHVALLNTGKVLIVAGSGNLATETVYRASVWDPGTDSFSTQPLTWDMFCNGMVVLPDGRVLVDGGNLRYDPFRGEPRNSVFDPATETFSDLENMAHGRWYPTVTVLGDGRVMTFSGLSETGSTNTAVEFYTVGSGWSAEYPAGWTPPLYPRIRDGDDQLCRHAKLRHLGAAAVDSRQCVQAPGDDLRRRQPGNGDHGNHRLGGGHSGLAVRTADVAAAD